MKHLPSLCAASLACLLLLPSCKFYSLTASTSHYLEAALSGGEAKHADYCVHEWSLSSSEIIELTNKKGDTLYFLPIEMSTKVTLYPFITYSHLTVKAMNTKWDSGEMKLSKPLDSKKLYIPLQLKDHSQAERSLRPYGIHREGLQLSKEPNLRSYLQKSAKLPARCQMRRIPIPHLEQMIRRDLILHGRYYATGNSLLVKTLSGAALYCIDVPLAITASVLASLYESTLGHTF